MHRSHDRLRVHPQLLTSLNSLKDVVIESTPFPNLHWSSFPTSLRYKCGSRTTKLLGLIVVVAPSLCAGLERWIDNRAPCACSHCGDVYLGEWKVHLASFPSLNAAQVNIVSRMNELLDDSSCAEKTIVLDFSNVEASAEPLLTAVWKRLADHHKPMNVFLRMSPKLLSLWAEVDAASPTKPHFCSIFLWPDSTAPGGTLLLLADPRTAVPLYQFKLKQGA